MVKYMIAHQQDDEDLNPKEVVGSKDLRETFKDTDRVRGSFSLNRVELYNFEANSPASVVAQINGYTDRTGVKASIDDQGHLVLLNSSERDIVITQGAAYAEAPRASSGDVATDVVDKLKAEGEKHRNSDEGGKPKNSILEDLGLEATDKNEEGQETARPGFETGLSEEDRRKQREAALQQGSVGVGVDRSGNPMKPGFDPNLPANQQGNPGQGIASANPSAPVAETAGSGGKTAEGLGRTGTTPHPATVAEGQQGQG